VTGTAADNVGVVAVEVRVDAGSYVAAQGAASWSFVIGTSTLTTGGHTLSARARDAAGNTSTVSASFAVAPVVDTTPPSTSIATPAADTTVGGTVSVSGTATDNTQVAEVDVSVDGGAYQAAQGTDNWSYLLNTSSFADGPHTLTARAVDSSGNVATTSEAVNVKNAPPAGVVEQMVTPEGATIQIYSGVPVTWSVQKIYDLLRPSAYELNLVGPTLVVKVQTSYASQTTTSASTTNGVYASFRATIYLDARDSSTLTAIPEATVAHEYGHAWSSYHLYLTQQGNWGAYLSARGLVGDSRLDTTLNWSKNEMLADDYRMLFGSPIAVSQSDYINPGAPDPRTVTGLRDFLATSW
jgi:hypothetical protein